MFFFCFVYLITQFNSEKCCWGFASWLWSFEPTRTLPHPQFLSVTSGICDNDESSSFIPDFFVGRPNNHYRTRKAPEAFFQLYICWTVLLKKVVCRKTIRILMMIFKLLHLSFIREKNIPLWMVLYVREMTLIECSETALKTKQ